MVRLAPRTGKEGVEKEAATSGKEQHCGRPKSPSIVLERGHHITEDEVHLEWQVVWQEGGAQVGSATLRHAASTGSCARAAPRWLGQCGLSANCVSLENRMNAQAAAEDR